MSELLKAIDEKVSSFCEEESTLPQELLAEVQQSIKEVTIRVPIDG